MKIPTFARRTEGDSTVADRPTSATTQRDDRTPVTTRTLVDPPRQENTTTLNIAKTETERARAVTAEREPARPAPDPAPAGPKPRASLLATLGLIGGVAGALLVLSGPLLGYGMGVAGLGLVLSIAGFLATRKRHVAGKTDALIGLLLSAAALVVGVLALTGQLNWLGTDMQPVTDAREWLDAEFRTRF